VPARPANRATGYIPTLDGWRAVAILWVLEGHSRRWWWHGLTNSGIADAGYKGVQLFFALSGFLICTLLLREEAKFGSISLKSFYTRRIFRIQPAALAYLLTIAILTVIGVFPPFWRGIAGALLMVRNLWPGVHGTVYWYTGHFWSLSVEEHFYLLLPGFLLLVRKRRLRILFTVTVLLEIWRIVVLSHPALQRSGDIVDLRTDLVLGGILLGSVFAIALTKEKLRRAAERWLKPWIALLFTAAVYTVLYFHMTRLWNAMLISTYPVLLTATVLHPDTWLGRLLEWPPLRFIGRISYSLYLWQELFLVPITRDRLHAHGALCLAAAFACAIASYYLIEMPMIRIGHRVAKRFSDSRPKPEDEALVTDHQRTSAAI
jgi:peptidoglycan/LPS O-acetylase OafA/YrhL